MCLQSVVDYMQKVGAVGITREGAKKAYHGAYVFQTTEHIMKTTKMYETNKMFLIPLCMTRGSLDQTLTMTIGSRAYDFLNDKRVNNVADYITQKEAKDDFIK